MNQGCFGSSDGPENNDEADRGPACVRVDANREAARVNAFDRHGRLAHQ